MKEKSLSHVQLLVTLWTAAYQALPSMGFARQEYWSEVPLPPSLFQHSRALIIGQEKATVTSQGSFQLLFSTYHNLRWQHSSNTKE